MKKTLYHEVKNENSHENMRFEDINHIFKKKHKLHALLASIYIESINDINMSSETDNARSIIYSHLSWQIIHLFIFHFHYTDPLRPKTLEWITTMLKQHYHFIVHIKSIIWFHCQKVRWRETSSNELNFPLKCWRITLYVAVYILWI